MTRCMLKVKSMPKKFWAKAIPHGVYFSNSSPTKNVKSQTLQEAWNGVKPRVDHLKSLGAFHMLICLTKEDSSLTIGV